jgi:Skp family chaperone for outer membrane proteins
MKIRHISAALVAGVSLAAAPVAFAQTTTPGGIVASGIGVAYVDLIVQNSKALKAASQALPTAYKAQIDQANARSQALRAQLKPLEDKIIADQKGPNPNGPAVQAEYEQYQQIKQAGEQEVERIIAPVKLANAFVLEQIQDKILDATQAAMTKRKVTLVLSRQAVIKGDSVYDINQDIVEALDQLLPLVSVTPPAGWLPREQREQRERALQQQQAEAQQSGAAASPSAKKQPQGR